MTNLFPQAASAHAGDIDNVVVLVHWLMLALFIGWGAFFVYVLVRFRRSRNPKADYTGVTKHTSTWLEISVAVAEAVLLIGFSIPLWAERVDDIPPEEQATVVRVVAQQFAWNIWYPGEDGVFGPQDISLVDEATNPLGLDRSQEAGADDIVTLNQLHLPVERPALIHLSSKDVIHGFNLPQFRIKQDAIPGLTIPVWFQPTLTTAQMREQIGDDEFQYEIACAQLCGNSHYRMRGFVTIETEEEFQAGLAEEAEFLGDGEDDFWGS